MNERSYQGLTAAQAEESRRVHGTNHLTQLQKEPLWKKLLMGFLDPMLLILIAALAIQMIFWAIGRGEWYEAAGIFAAILIANTVGVLSENKQEGKAAALRAQVLAGETAKVLRDGRLQEIPVGDVVVGDIVKLQAGDKAPADGAVVRGRVHMDQAALNGETEEAEKRPLDPGAPRGDTRDLLNSWYIYRGTVACEGECLLQVDTVGDRTVYGQLALEMQEDTRDTPLKVKMGVLAKQITRFGYIGAAVIAGAYLFQQLVLAGAVPADGLGWFRLVLEAISLAVVIIVMAVPEGLPMMISMVLSMNMGKMMRDNVLVRRLNGIETAGELNILFSDKTGTITEGRLSVTELMTGGGRTLMAVKDAGDALGAALVTGLGVNNSASPAEGGPIGGNSTDRALMAWLMAQDLGPAAEAGKGALKVFHAFDSAKKYSSATVDTAEGPVTYIKGAPERILARCTQYLDEDGVCRPLTDKKELEGYMDRQAARSMRLLAVARRAGEGDLGELTLAAIVSIRDNVLPTSVEAIRQVRAAGVQVVMVTGDRLETAAAIAKEAGLITGPEDEAITSQELGGLSDRQVKELLPRLRVVARALPTDKSRLVRLAQEMNLVVGMTGDGVNDAPALKKADVGFAMGSGTEVAKEAGDVIIMDDNFRSIEKAILYGRTIFRNIRKFLVFQLTVNVAAVTLCFVAPLLGISQPISLISLLFINLVMDTLAAVAFGNEPALDRYMLEKPPRRDESILSGTMMSQILTTGCYIVAVSLAVLLAPGLERLYGGDGTVIYRESAMLAFFMLTVICNGFYARSPGFHILEHIRDNKAFLWVMAVVAALLAVLIHGVGLVAGLTGISPATWGWMALLALGSLPVDALRKGIRRLAGK